MGKSPIKRAAGQTVEEMACQMEASKAGNKMYRKTYGEVASELKSEALSAALEQQMYLMGVAADRGRVNLDDLEELKAATEIYLKSCQISGTFPTFLAYSASLGYSRQAVYAYISRHTTKTAEFLDNLRSSFAAIVAEMGLKRACSEALAIFLLKNSGQGLADKTEVDISAKAESPLGEKTSTEELKRKYLEDAYGLYADDEEA